MQKKRIFKHANISKALILTLLFVLASCGSGGGSAPQSNTPQNNNSPQNSPSPAIANASPAGIWQGTFHSNLTGLNEQATGIVIGNGEARFSTTAPLAGVQYVGSVSTQGNNLSGTITGYAPQGYVFSNGLQWETVSISGTVQAQDSISGTYNNGVGDTGTFSLTYNQVYNNASSLSFFTAANGFFNQPIISGPFNESGGLITEIGISTDSNGNITGNYFVQNSNLEFGLMGGSAVTIIDPAHNAYRITLNFGGDYGNYTGLCFVEGNTINLFISNGSNAISGTS